MSKCFKKPFDFTVFQGDDYAFSVFYKNPDETPIDVTGYEARLQARKEYEDEGVYIDLALGSGITTTALEGRFSILIPNEQTAAMPPAVYVYDLEVTSPAGLISKLVFGKITILAEVTRA